MPMIAAGNNPAPRWMDHKIPPPFKSHPDYRLDLEVLIRLPKSTPLIPLDLIARDLGVTQSLVQIAIDRLRVNGYRIRTTAVATGLAASLSVIAWDKAQAIGAEYFERVYRCWLCPDVVAESEALQ